MLCRVVAIFFLCLEATSSLTLQFKVSNCTLAKQNGECPTLATPKYAPEKRVGTFSLCDEKENICYCRDPFVGPRCTHILNDDLSATVAYVLYYTFCSPLSFCLWLSSMLVLRKKLRIRAKLKNMKAIRLMRHHSNNKSEWAKNSRRLFCNCGLTVSSAFFFMVANTIFFFRNLLDPFYLRGVFSKHVGYMLNIISYILCLISFVQLFGAYTKLTLRAGSPYIDKKFGKKARRWLPRVIRRTCLLILIALLVHQLYVAIVAIIKKESFGDDWYTFTPVSLGVMVLIFATFTLVYGITLIRKIQNLKDNLDKKDEEERTAISNLSNLSSIGTALDESVEKSQDSEVAVSVDTGDASNDQRDAAEVLRSKRFFFITVLLKRYLTIMGIAGYAVFLASLLHTYGPNDKYFFLFCTLYLDLSVIFMSYTVLRLLEGTNESTLYTLLTSGVDMCRQQLSGTNDDAGDASLKENEIEIAPLEVEGGKV